MFIQVDWNDFIGDFITLKAEKPHLLREMIKREQDYHRMQESQRKIKQQTTKYEALTSQLQNQISNFNRVKVKRQQLDQELNGLRNQIESVQMQTQKHKQVSLKVASKKGRVDLKSSRRMSRQIEHSSKKDIGSLTMKYQRDKNQLRKEVSEYIANRVSLREQLQRVTIAHNTIRSNEAAMLKCNRIRENLQILKAQHAAARQKRSNLYEQHRQWLSESERPQKKQKMLNDMFQQCKKNIRQAFKDIKKFVLSDQPREGKKYDEMMNRLSKYRPAKRTVDFYKELDREFNHLQERYQAPPFYEKNRVDSEQMMRRLRRQMELQDLEESFTIKSKSEQQIKEFYQSYESLQKYLKQRVRMEENADQQVQARRVILQRKVKDIELSKGRIKTQKSL